VHLTKQVGSQINLQIKLSTRTET